MGPDTMQLNYTDVQQLLKAPSESARQALVTKVAVAFRQGNFSDTEAAIAADIFRLILKDAEQKVRATLAEHLTGSPNAPHDVVLRLANDEANDVASRVLEHSQVLTEEDLISLIKSTRQVMRLSAVARRSHVTARMSDTLLEVGQEAALEDLFRNQGAKFNAQGLEQHWDMISAHGSLLDALARHGGLPLTIAEKMFSVVSEELKRHISRNYKFRSPIVQKAANDAREWELLGILPLSDMPNPDEDERVEDLVDQLHATARLTHSLLIRSLCTGCLNLFEAGVARLAGVPRANARILIMGGPIGFHAIYKTANMPEGFVDAVEKLLNIALELSGYGYAKPEDFRKRVVEQVYIQGYQHSVDNMPYLLSIIGGKLSGAPAGTH